MGAERRLVRFASYLLAGAGALVLAACASLIGNEIQVSEAEKPNPNASTVKYLASVRIAGYVDARKVDNPRKIGISEERVFGLSGSDLILDRDVTDVVTASLRKRLDDMGIRMLAKDDASALFELSGLIKELKYDVKARDQVLIKVETTLKEVATGKVVWAGEVVQKDERFAGVSGNSKSDIADYLKQEVGVVAGKTAEAVNTVLRATRPELFSTPGTKVVSGVTVFVSPNGPGSPAPDTALPQPVPGASGTLVVRTEPARAKVYLDGVYYGLSPLNIQGAAGIHTVEVRLSGYKNASEKVAVRAGAATELEFQLEK